MEDTLTGLSLTCSTDSHGWLQKSAGVLVRHGSYFVGKRYRFANAGVAMIMCRDNQSILPNYWSDTEVIYDLPHVCSIWI